MRIFATGWSEGYDGPGRRWVVYLKGCNFRCRWCANPEGLLPDRQMLFYPTRGFAPSMACPNGAVRQTAEGVPAVLDRSRCDGCAGRDCVRVWKHPAFELAGENLSVDALLAKARQSAGLFGGDGGVTFGGGEATLQADELDKALAGLRSAGVRTAVETNAATDGFPRLIGRCDLILADLKCVSAGTHRTWTGADNAPVLANLERAARELEGLWVRIPVVTGLNDGEDEQERMIQFLACLRAARRGLVVELLPMHHFGKPKYDALGMDYPMEGVLAPAPELVERFRDRLRKEDIDTRIAPRR